MRRASRAHVFNEHNPDNTPQFTVQPGEIFEVETELCTGDWLHSLDEVWTPEKQSGCNPCVVVAVSGARPGDSLRVHIHSIVPDVLGYTGFTNRNHGLANQVVDRDWGYNIRVVRIENGFVHFTPSLRLPIDPMIGTLGTAPDGAGISNACGGRHGGNMDAQEVRSGAIVTLPVEVPEALLHIGDVHAIQGDGEINGAGGIECRALVTMHAEIIPRPTHSGCVRVENATHLCAVACEGDMEECCTTATRELLHWMCDDYGMNECDAYLLLGQVMGMRVTQLVNPTRTIIATVPKAVLS